MSTTVLLCQAADLLWNIVLATLQIVLHLPYALVRCCAAAVAPQQAARPSKCTFYEGVVEHVRKRPVHHAFKYPVRMAVVDLDDAPSWFAPQARDHMTADEARRMAGTEGAVQLLTHPHAAGYVQNPISVYYCRAAGGYIARCIAEVTNTPWGERVTFAFDPAGDTVAKSLHVSPLMDMQGLWTLKASSPGKRLALSVSVRHPELGDFFVASLTAQRCSATAAQNEYAGFSTLWRYGYEPQRVAVWIYWEALQLLRKGVPFYGPPDERQKAELEKRVIGSDTKGSQGFRWRPAARFPWRSREFCCSDDRER